MLNYFLRAKNKDNTGGTNYYIKTSNYTKDPKDDDDDDKLNEDKDNGNNSDSDKDKISSNSNNNDYCGLILLSEALRTDVAIAGWMDSPHPQVMAHCKKLHAGEHKTAVTRLNRRWMGHIGIYL
jgi:hypothetical protein